MGECVYWMGKKWGGERGDGGGSVCIGWALTASQPQAIAFKDDPIVSSSKEAHRPDCASPMRDDID